VLEKKKLNKKNNRNTMAVDPFEFDNPQKIDDKPVLQSSGRQTDIGNSSATKK
jgi:hypothetical protein